jgi:hypothetical protein
VADQVIPLTSSANQTFSVQLIVDGGPLTLNLSISYSSVAGYWQMAVSDVNSTPLVASVPLITGWYPATNLLAQYAYLAIGSAALLNTGTTAMDYPGRDTLDQFSLVWSDTP